MKDPTGGCTGGEWAQEASEDIGTRENEVNWANGKGNIEGGTEVSVSNSANEDFKVQR